MPRNVDPSNIQIGGGTAPQGSVEDSSLRNPSRDTIPLRVHIEDPANVHEASAIHVVDAAGNFSSDEVEGALAELATGGGATEQNGVYQGCTYVAAGLTVTLATPSSVVINGTLRDLSGSSLPIVNNATNWLYVHGTTGVLSNQTGAAAPTISSPEHVLLARIVTAAGAITASRDARWFVRNNDRKLPCTVRSVGAEADRNSEAAFESIDAAILYLENFGASGIIRNTTLILKGSQTISSSVVIPLNGVTLQGEDGCILTLSLPNTTLVDVSGRISIRIRDITFRTNEVGAIAIGCPTNGVITEVYVERCVFSAGTQDWETGIDFNAAGPQNRVVVRDCDITATAYGIRMRDPTNSRVLDTVVTESGSGGTYGFHLGNLLGPVGNTEDCQVQGVRVVGFGTGGFLHGPRMQVVGCNLTGADTGLMLFWGVTDGVVSGTTLRLSGTTGLLGIDVYGDNIRIADCKILNPKAAGTYAAEVPVGIRIATGSDYITITGTKVEGFLNSVTPGGYGIFAAGTSVDLIIDGCQITGAYQGISTTAGTNMNISGTIVRDVDIGIVLKGGNSIVTGGSVTVSSTRGVTGISVEDSDTIITGCTVVSARNVFAGETPVGISIGTSDVKVSNCIIRGWRNSAGALGVGVKTAAGAARITIDATTIIGCWSGFVTLSAVAADEITLSDCLFRNIDQDAIYFVNSNRVRVSDCTLINSGSTDAIYYEDGTDLEIVNCKIFGNSGTVRGIHLVGADVAADRVRRFVISGNNIQEVTGDGILLEGYVQNGVVSNNQVDCFLPAAPSDPSALACIRLASTGTTALIKSVVVSGNVCQRAQNGIIVTGVNESNMAWNVSVVNNTVHHCAVGSAGTTTCSGVDITWGLNMAVEGNTLSSIGLLIDNGDLESAPTAGANVIPYGVRTLNSYHIRVGGNSVTNPTAAGAGFSFGIFIKIKDNTLPVDARTISITDNQVRATDGTSPIGTGIMVSVGTSGAGGNTTTLTGLIVSGNSTRRIEYYGIAIVSGGGCTMQQVVVSGNSVSSVLNAALGYGISLTAQAASVLADGILREVEVVGNNVGNAEKYGIYVASGDGCRLNGVSVRDNTVADIGDIGIYFNGAMTPADFGRFLVSGNVVSGAANEGIFLTSTDFDLDDVTVLGNTVMGSPGAATGQGIRISTTAAVAGRVSADRLTVSGNKVYTQNTICINVNLDGWLQQAVISGNVAMVNTNSASPLVLSLTNGGTDIYSGEISIVGNTLVGGGAVSVALDGINLRNFIFSDNIRQDSADYGFQLEVLNATLGTKEAVDGVTISGNTFEDIQQQGVRLLFGDATSIEECSNISVTDNRFNECALDGTGNTALFIRGNARLQNLRVTGNDFKSIGTLDSVATGNINVKLGSDAAATNSGENVNISGNSFNTCKGVAILVEDLSLATGWTLVNLKVEGNSVQQQTNDAIRLDLAAFTTVRAVSISGNTIDNVSGVASDTGIRVVGPTSSDLNQLSVCGNTIRTTGSVNSGAIYISSSDDVNGLQVTGNSLEGTLATVAGIYVTVAGDLKGANVSENLLETCAGAGIYVLLTGADADGMAVGVSINDNTVNNSAGDGVKLVTETGAGSSPTLTNSTLRGNSIYSAGGEGLSVETVGNSECLVISGNAIKDSGDTGIYVRPFAATLASTVVSGNSVMSSGDKGIYIFGTTGDFRGLTLSDNSVRDSDLEAIELFGAGDYSAISISGNSVYNWNVAASATRRGGIHVVNTSSDVANVSVSGNTLRCDVIDTYGLYFSFGLLGEVSVRTLNVTGNVLRLGNNGNTTSMIFECGGFASTQAGLGITGNSFRGSSTGVTFTGSFAPEYSVCAHNSERTYNGGVETAGNWAAFVVPFKNSQTTLNQD